MQQRHGTLVVMTLGAGASVSYDHVRLRMSTVARPKTGSVAVGAATLGLRLEERSTSQSAACDSTLRSCNCAAGGFM